MATREDIYVAIRNADKAGDSAAVQKLSAYLQTMDKGPVVEVQFTDPTTSPAKAPDKVVNKDYQAGRNAPGALQGLASVLNGPLMGFGDEVLGAVGGAIDTLKPTKLSDLIVGKKTFAENYRANRDTVRGMQDAQREENPWMTGITQTMASAPMMLLGRAKALADAAPAVAQTVGLGMRSWNAAKVGAGYGAVGGAGNSTSDTLLGDAGNALMGGVTGATLGGLVTPFVAGMGAAGQSAWSRISETAAGAYAREKLAQAIARDGRGALFTSGQANPVTQAEARLNKLGPEAAMVDAGGKNTNQLLDTLATLPGRTKQGVAQLQHQRTAGVGERLRTAADEALGTQGQRLGTTVENLVEQRQTAAAPLYERLRQTNITQTPALASMVNAADELGALTVARQIATANEVPFGLDAARQAGGQLNMHELDLVKQGVDQLLQGSRAIGKDGMLTPLGHALTRLNTRLKGELDNLTLDPRTGESLYATARNAFAGPSAMIDAANMGRRALSQDEAGIGAMVRNMSQGELEAFRIGAGEALRQKLGTQGGQTNVINMWKEPATQEKLAMIFGSEDAMRKLMGIPLGATRGPVQAGDRAAREFATAAAREGVLKRVQSVGTGSQTASRQAGMGDLDVSPLTDVGVAAAQAKTGNIMGAFGAASNAWNRVATPEGVRDEMGRLLMSKGPQAQQNLNALSDLIQQINLRNASTSNIIGSTLGTGSQIGNRLVQPLPY